MWLRRWLAKQNGSVFECSGPPGLSGCAARLPLDWRRCCSLAGEPGRDEPGGDRRFWVLSSCTLPHTDPPQLPNPVLPGCGSLRSTPNRVDFVHRGHGAVTHGSCRWGCAAASHFPTVTPTLLEQLLQLPGTASCSLSRFPWSVCLSEQHFSCRSRLTQQFEFRLVSMPGCWVPPTPPTPPPHTLYTSSAFGPLFIFLFMHSLSTCSWPRPCPAGPSSD